MLVFLYKSNFVAEVFLHCTWWTLLSCVRSILFHSFCSLFCSYCGDFTQRFVIENTNPLAIIKFRIWKLFLTNLSFWTERNKWLVKRIDKWIKKWPFINKYLVTNSACVWLDFIHNKQLGLSSKTKNITVISSEYNILYWVNFILYITFFVYYTYEKILATRSTVFFLY